MDNKLELLRMARQHKIDRRVLQLRVRADTLDKIAKGLMAEMNSYHGDIAFFSQPASPSSPFGRRRAKIYARYDKGIQLGIEADELRKKADYMEKEGAVVKGDAERKREQERVEQDKIITVGSRVYDFCFGDGVVAKVNKKTYTIKFDVGSKFTRDKVFVKLLERKTI